LTNFSLGVQRPVHQHLPGGNGTSVGHDAVELARLAGLVLDDWQSWFLIESLRTASDRWGAFEVGLIVPRQNGKGSLLEARQLAGLFLLGEPLGVHTAHEFKTSFEHFIRITNLIEGCADLDRKVQRIRRGAGEQAVELRNGCRLRFLARSTGSGRGLTGDTIYLDEAFALTSAMMGALLPTLSAVPNPQLWYTSSAPRTSSEVLHDLRKRGRSGDAGRLLYAEWGLDVGADLTDEANWFRTNPALGIRIGAEFVRAELDAMRSMPDEFGRERLGIAEPLEDDVTVVPLETWAGLVDVDSRIVSHRQIALDVSPDHRWACFAAAGRRDDGRLHVEAFDHRPGTAWVLDRAAELAVRWQVPIRLEKTGPAGGFIAKLAERGVPVDEITSAGHAHAVGQFIDATLGDDLRHLGAASLTAALKGAVLKPSGDATLWSRRSSRVDITPLVAVTVALGGVPAPAGVGAAAFIDLADEAWDGE
jgi:hypothetical protein